MAMEILFPLMAARKSQLRDCKALENNENLLLLKSKYLDSMRKRKLELTDLFHEL
jgi:hypothetical protein